MNNPKPSPSFRIILPLIVLYLSLLDVHRALAATVYWAGTNGVSTTTNWSDPLNIVNNFPSGAAGSPYNNEVNVVGNTEAQSPGIVTMNIDGPNPTGGEPTPQTWELAFVHTNGYHTVLIQPGVQFQIQAYNGTPGSGFYINPANYNAGATGGGNAVASGPYTNNVVVWGTNASFWLNGGFRIDANSTVVENHYSILDMSGLDLFVQTNQSLGSSAERFLVCGGVTRGQALVYLAKTNIFNNYSDLTIGYNGNTGSNSLPLGVYLGYSNSIVTGPAGNGNQIAVALQGATNAFLKFNPAFLGGGSKPTVYLSGNGASGGNGGTPTVSGMMSGCFIGRSDQAVVPSYGVVDFTGGIVNWSVGQIYLGRSGTNIAPASSPATGILSFDDGTITANDIWCGWQQSNATANAAAAIGVINVGASATLQVNNVLRLGLVNGTQAAGTTGALNVNGGTVVLNLVTNSPGASGDVIALTNATLGVTLNQAGITNIPVTTLSLGGATNIINILSITPVLGGAYPVRLHVIRYGTLLGTMNLGLGTLPASYNSSYTYSGYLDTTTTPGLVDLVLTAGPPAARMLTWTGLDGGVADGNWDVGTTPDWQTNGVATLYNQYDLVTFNDSIATSGGSSNISMTTTLTPYSVNFSNSQVSYVLGGSGLISGPVGISKLGSGVLVLDDSGGNNFTGGIITNAGIIQVGNADGNGNLGSGPIVNGGTLAFNNGAQANIANIISGSGSVVQEGGNTLELSGVNTYTGTTLATNGSTLQAGGSAAFGASSGNLIIANGSTLDINGNSLGAKPIVVSGNGSGNGAIINSGGAVYDNGGGGGGLTTSLTLATNASLYFGTRWDLGAGGTLSTGGKPYNLTLSGNSGYMSEWRNIAVDTNLANITITSGGLGIVGTTGLGNSNNALLLPNGTQLTFYNNGGANVNVNKQFIMQDGGTIANGGGANVMRGGLLLTNANGSGYCTFQVGGTSLTISNVITGNGILYQQEPGTSTLIVAGNSPAFTGGILGYVGTLVLNGTVDCGVTNEAGASLMGTGSASGSMDIFGGLTPGGANTAGTMTVGGGLILESGASLTNNLNSATTVGGGVNSLIQVTGDISPNGNTLWINPLGPLSVGSTYTVITYTGNLDGTPFSGAATTIPSMYTFNVVNVTSSSPKKIQVVVTSGPNPALLSWNNASGNGEWDVSASPNWSNLTTQASSDYFYNFDPVLFLDTITNSANPSTNVDIASGVVVVPGVITNNSTVNYTISGAGKISSSASLVKLGPSTLTLSTTNDFTGSSTIAGGTLVADSPSALGATNGSVIIINGGTLDLHGFTLGAKPVVVSGAGVSGNGAIVNNGPSPIYDNGNGLTQITLATNATFGGGLSRWDLGGDSGGVLNTGGKAYNLTLLFGAGNYEEWNNVTADASLASITLASGTLGIKGSTQLGNSTNALNVLSNATLVLYLNTDLGVNVALTKAVLLSDGATLQNGQGTNSLLGTVTLSTNASGGSGLCTFNVGSTSLSLSNAISGPGTLIKTGSAPLILGGANTYSGATILNAGTVSLVGSGSISGSPLMVLLSGTTLDVSGRNDGTLTLASGQTLEGFGTVNGNLTVNSGATVAPGTNLSTIGTLTVTTNVILSGTATMDLSAPSTCSKLTASIITYGGTLNLVFPNGTLAAGDSFKLFSANSYNGSFSSISPATPGAGLAWNTNGLGTGVVSVVSAVLPVPGFSSILLSGNNVVLQGTNGLANGTYYLLTSTNVTLALSNWTVLSTNQFNAGGNFSVTNSVTPGVAQRYYAIEVP